MTKELLPVDGYAEYADKSQGSYPKMKEIRLCIDLQKDARSQGIPVGNFFVFDGNVEQGEDPIFTDIGNEFLGIVLRDAQHLKFYDKAAGETTFSSSEYRSNFDPIVLFDRSTGEDQIVACLPYMNKAEPDMSIKHLKDTSHTDLGVKYVAYVLYDGEVYKFNFAATDNTGCENKKFKPLGFSEADAESFHSVKPACYKEAGAKVMFSHVIRFFSKPAFDNSTDFIKGFEISGRVGADQKELIDDSLLSLTETLQQKFAFKTSRAWGNTEDKSSIICFDPRHISYLVANPRVFTQQDSLPKLEEGQVVPEIAEVTKAETVDDIAKDFEGPTPVEAEVVTPKEEIEKPDHSQKPRNKKEAIKQNKETKEYIEESGVGDATKIAAEVAHADAADMEKKMEDPKLKQFMDDTETEPSEEKKDGPEGW